MNPTPPPGQPDELFKSKYGALKVQAREALWKVRYPTDIDTAQGNTDDLLEAVHPIYVAALGAKDRAMNQAVEAAAGEYVVAMEGLLERAEQAEREIERLQTLLVDANDEYVELMGFHKDLQSQLEESTFKVAELRRLLGWDATATAPAPAPAPAVRLAEQPQTSDVPQELLRALDAHLWDFYGRDVRPWDAHWLLTDLPQSWMKTEQGWVQMEAVAIWDSRNGHVVRPTDRATHLYRVKQPSENGAV